MKNIKFILNLFVAITIFGCTDDKSDVDLSALSAPKNISALVTTSQDNTGTVTFLPKGEGVTHYEIYFGDGTAAPAIVKAGETVTHVYSAGTHQAKIVGITLSGQKTEVMQQVVVSFGPPTNLVATVTTGANLSVKVTATANSETFFKVYFGDGGANEVPVEFMEGQEVSHTYASAGTYQVKVVALNGGITTIEAIKTVVITNLTAAPVPTKSPANVISLFSDTYTNIGVATWHTDWSNATLTDIAISGNNAKEYSALGFVGVEPTTPINATTMTHFHIDVWSADFTAFKIKLVDYGPNGVWEQNGDNVEHEITIDAPAKEQWVGIDIPLSNFTGLTTRAHIAQIIFSGAPYAATKVVIDNVYFYKEAASMTAAPTPTLSAGNVISLFSNAYTNVGVDTWKTSWSVATLEDVTISGNATKKYSALDFVGIETTGSNQINASTMTHFHTDVWSDNFTEFKIKLVDFGANGTYGGGDDVEDTYILTLPTKGSWISVDIPLSTLTALSSRSHISQIIYAATPTGTANVYIDNVYFHK